MAAPPDTTGNSVLKKFELEGTLAEENLMIRAGKLRDENPLDTSEKFEQFLLACRHGDLRKCQELMNLGVNINGKDKFDYTPLIIVCYIPHPPNPISARPLSILFQHDTKKQAAKKLTDNGYH